MILLASILVGAVALLHLYILVLEMVLWTRPLGMKVFRNSPEKAQATRVLAANQGLYNGFLAAGLGWGLVAQRVDVMLFFLGCVVVAGLYGGWSVSRRIVFVQALPAALAIAAVLLAY
ncbi:MULTISPECIES: DUF1304 domain-containing protein [Xanthomonas]|uniref:DUF1304 domain-containing protein n=1 Tax=Xanthomonas indica TaxID=2912242 RepID=A0AAU8I3L3_9XANT|nr:MULTISPECIES: DUF1304 domain-containing protein [Xanthomonas]MBB6367991.1 putative membrane protein [Xanthomonas sp. F10]MCI2261458.1 DUF1304 domain-containing protein [Xanthomonas indica]MXV32601.1 DUF1304 domain-containing protein [Xanthomonas sp. LMG 8989]